MMMMRSHNSSRSRWIVHEKRFLGVWNLTLWTMDCVFVWKSEKKVLWEVRCLREDKGINKKTSPRILRSPTTTSLLLCVVSTFLVLLRFPRLVSFVRIFIVIGSSHVIWTCGVIRFWTQSKCSFRFLGATVTHQTCLQKKERSRGARRERLTRFLNQKTCRNVNILSTTIQQL